MSFLANYLTHTWRFVISLNKVYEQKIFHEKYTTVSKMVSSKFAQAQVNMGHYTFCSATEWRSGTIHVIYVNTANPEIEATFEFKLSSTPELRHWVITENLLED